MTRLSSNIINNYNDIINLKKNKNEFIIFLEDVLGVKISEISYVELLQNDFETEYDFALYKYLVKTINKELKEIYLRKIKNNKIKQSIFCYWCMLYEEELIYKEKMNTINKVIIKEKEKNEYKRSIFLEIENNNTGILEKGTEIFLVDLLKYIKIKKMEFFPVNIKEDDVLLIGMV